MKFTDGEHLLRKGVRGHKTNKIGYFVLGR